MTTKCLDPNSFPYLCHIIFVKLSLINPVEYVRVMRPIPFRYSIPLLSGREIPGRAEP